VAHPWLRSYPAGIDWDAPIKAEPVYQILEDAVTKWPDRPAIEFMQRKFSYRELGALVDRAANGFRALGVGAGSHVGLYLPNTPHAVISLFAILKAGGIVVNFSPLDAEAVLEHKVEDSETDFIVTLNMKTLYPKMERLLGKTRLKALIVGDLAEMCSSPDETRSDIEAAGQVLAVPLDDRHIPFTKLFENDENGECSPIGDVTKSVALLQYTGGTTGIPKGAMLTHGNLSAASYQFWMSTQGAHSIIKSGEERTLIVLPLFHIYALTANLLLCLRIGAEIILHTRFELEPVLKDIQEKQVTLFIGVPTMYLGMLSYPGIETIDLSSLKHCGSGGAPLPVEVSQWFKKKTGCDISDGWGMTETSAAGTFMPAGRLAKAGSCGIPYPGITIKFVSVDNPDQEVPLGQRGELCIKGPNVTLGYWKNENATAEMRTRDGYLRTGDVGYMDEDGYVFIVDRIKDMLLCGGYNVYPRNIEEAIYQHPSVAECCVIGVPDAYRGQSPKAFIALKAGAEGVTLDEMKSFLKSRLGKHEMISELEVRAALPRTPVGKLSKKELIDEEARKRVKRARGS
jgi:long-chain acyl-CoA synthetase